MSRICSGKRTLVKTWAQRGTLHLHRTDELPLWVGAQAGAEAALRGEVVAEALQAPPRRRPGDPDRGPGGAAEGPLTREELAEQVHAGLGRGYGDLLKPVAFRGELIFTQDTSLRGAGAVRADDPEEARQEVARRYLTRYGPATREDLAKWFGHPSPAQAGSGSAVRSRPSSAGRSGGTPRRSRRRSRPASCGCCPRSTSTSWPRRATTGATSRRSGSTGPEAGSRPCCWWTA